MHVSTDKDVRIFFYHPENGRKHPLEIASDIASKILLPKIVYFIRAALYSASRMPSIEEKIPIKWLKQSFSQQIALELVDILIRFKRTIDSFFYF